MFGLRSWRIDQMQEVCVPCLRAKYIVFQGFDLSQGLFTTCINVLLAICNMLSTLFFKIFKMFCSGYSAIFKNIIILVNA